MSATDRHPNAKVVFDWKDDETAYENCMGALVTFGQFEREVCSLYSRVIGLAWTLRHLIEATDTRGDTTEVLFFAAAALRDAGEMLRNIWPDTHGRIYAVPAPGEEEAPNAE